MALHVEATALNGVVVLRPDIHRDPRGFFVETFRADHLRELGLPDHFLQENQSRSSRGVIRGLHFQWKAPMAKLMRVTVGRAFLVAVDIRPGSPTLGQWYGLEASDENALQLFAPPGFARGLCALEDRVEVHYLCTATYNPAGETGIRWDDPRVGINWPVERPLLSDKDASAQTLDEWLARPEAGTFRI